MPVTRKLFCFSKDIYKMASKKPYNVSKEKIAHHIFVVSFLLSELMQKYMLRISWSNTEHLKRTRETYIKMSPEIYQNGLKQRAISHRIIFNLLLMRVFWRLSVQNVKYNKKYKSAMYFFNELNGLLKGWFVKILLHLVDDLITVENFNILK